MAVRGLRIPPGEANYANEADHTFEKDSYITGFNPHMHLRGKAAKFVATFPDGARASSSSTCRSTTSTGSTRYTYRDPVFAPKGTKVHMTLVWDNSAGNPANPDPTAEVDLGSADHRGDGTRLHEVHRGRAGAHRGRRAKATRRRPPAAGSAPSRSRATDQGNASAMIPASAPPPTANAMYCLPSAR